jgi:hypothetical protein
LNVIKNINLILNIKPIIETDIFVNIFETQEEEDIKYLVEIFDLLEKVEFLNKDEKNFIYLAYMIEIRKMYFKSLSEHHFTNNKDWNIFYKKVKKILKKYLLILYNSDDLLNEYNYLIKNRNSKIFKIELYKVLTKLEKENLNFNDLSFLD